MFSIACISQGTKISSSHMGFMPKLYKQHSHFLEEWSQTNDIKCTEICLHQMFGICVAETGLLQFNLFNPIEDYGFLKKKNCIPEEDCPGLMHLMSQVGIIFHCPVPKVWLSPCWFSDSFFPPPSLKEERGRSGHESRKAKCFQNPQQTFAS